MENKLISFVVPCYNEEAVLPMFYNEITRITALLLEKYPYLSFEYLFVNDGSKDNTLKILRSYALLDESVRYVSFSRNFGKEAALIAGLEASKGDFVVTLDADLQHPPEKIPEMYEIILQGEYDCVGTRRVSRKGDPKLLSFFSDSFYKVINKISQTQIINGAQDFRFMTRQMVDSIIEMSEVNRFSKGIFSWVGFDTKYLDTVSVPRAAGVTTWSFWKLFKYSLEGIMAFTVAPLAWSFIAAIWLFLAALTFFILGGFITDGGIFAILGSIFFVGAVQLVFIGVIGLYLSKTYTETKRRPKYIVKETETIYKSKEN